MEAALQSWKCINPFSTSDNNQKAANLQEKLIEKARVPNSTKITKWYNQLLNSLKHKGLWEEDITDTGLEKVIWQFDNDENLISTYDDETVDNAPLINTKNDRDKTESEDDGNEDSIASNYETKYFPSKIMSCEESDDSYLGSGSFQVNYSAKKEKIIWRNHWKGLAFFNQVVSGTNNGIAGFVPWTYRRQVSSTA